jgi:uncharacterized membrane protein YhhN
MDPIWLMPPAALLLASLLFFEYRKSRTTALLSKASLSILFVAVAALQHATTPAYYWTMLAGFVLCLGGDVLLAIPGEKTFLAGLVSFLLGHICYVLAFFGLASPGVFALVGLVIVIAIAAVIFRWLAPHLDDMAKPVVAYMLVISVMVFGALSAMGDSSLPTTGRVFILVGAIAFFVSDIFVAKDRFVDGRYSNRLIGLPLYYAAQFLLAFSIGFI